MLKKSIEVAFNELVDLAMMDQKAELQRVLAETQATFTGHGMGISGALMNALCGAAKNSLRARGAMILGELLRCLAAHGIRLTDQNIEVVARLIDFSIQVQIADARGDLFGFSIFATAPFQQARIQIEDDFDQCAKLVQRKAQSELRLASAATATLATAGEPQIVINGPVGVFQTGQGSHVGSVTQLTDQSRTDIINAIERAEASLGASPTDDHTREFVELLAETKAELTKPKPNGIKIVSGLKGAAEAVKFAGALRPAYDALKPALALLGVYLP